MDKKIHYLARIYWVRTKDEVEGPPKTTTRCDNQLSTGDGILWTRVGGASKATCEACILFHFLNPEGTEKVTDHNWDAYEY